MWTLVFKRGFKHLKCYTNDVFSFSAAGNLAFHSSYIQPLDALRTGHHLTAMGQDRFTAQGYQTNLRHNHTLHQIWCQPKPHDRNHDSRKVRITHWSLPAVRHPWETVPLGFSMACKTCQLGPECLSKDATCPLCLICKIYGQIMHLRQHMHKQWCLLWACMVH